MAERQAICEEFPSGSPLPTPQVTDQQPSEAPAQNAGSFFDHTEKTNAGGLITPVDEFSGLPLPILPTKNPLPLGRPEIADWHHPFHPKEHPLLKTTGGLALRNCRVQLVHRNFHNESSTRYHRFFEGPPIPDSQDEQFRIVVLASAGYVPGQAINTRSGEPQVVDLNAVQARQLRQTMRKAIPQDESQHDLSIRNQVFHYRNLRYGYDDVRKFLTQHTLEQPLSHLRENLIDEFLYTNNEERKVYLGHLLLAKKVEVAAERVEEIYVQARKTRSLHPLMPSSPATFIKHKLGTPEARKGLFPRLAAQLAVFHGVSGLTIRGERAIM